MPFKVVIVVWSCVGFGCLTSRSSSPSSLEDFILLTGMPINFDLLYRNDDEHPNSSAVHQQFSSLASVKTQFAPW